MMRRIKQLLQSKSVKNSLWIIFERIFSTGITAVITVLSARFLGTESFGTISYGLTFATLFGGIMKLGLDSIIVDELMRHKDKAASFLGTSIILRFGSSLISMILILLVLLIVNADQNIVIVVTLIQSTILIFQSFHVLDFWFQSRLDSKYVSIAKVNASLIMAGYSAYLLWAGKSIFWFAASTSLSALALAIVLVIFYLRRSQEGFQYSFADARYLLGKSHHFIIVSIISTIYTQIDRIMIGNMKGQAEVGIYSAALTVCVAWIFFPQAITISLRPVILAAKNHSYDLYMRRLKQLYFILFWLSMGICGLLAVSAPLLMPLLFGSEYQESVLIVQTVVWYVPLSVLGTARSIWTVSERKYKYPKYYMFHGLVLNISLNLLLIPQYGIMGAVISTLLTEFWTCFIAPMFFKSTRVHTRILIQALVYNLGEKGDGIEHSR